MTLAQQMELKLEDIITYIDLDMLRPNPYQPESRANVSKETAEEFGESIERSGLIHFPIVRRAKKDGCYEVGDGWLRRAGYSYLYKVKCLEKYARLPCVVRELDDRQMADLSLEANLQRKDFNSIELAAFYKKYLADFGVTQEEFAASRGISQEKVSNTIRLLELPEDIQARIISREISETHGRQLLRLKEMPDKQKKLAESSVKASWTVGDLDNQVSSELWRDSRNLDPKDQSWNNPPAFDISGCEGCAHAEKLTNYGKKQLRCLDPDCWQVKQDAARAVELEAEKAELKEHGIERLYDHGQLKYNEYNYFYGDWLEQHPECQTCVHRAGLRSGGEIIVVCIDTECFEKKRKKASAAASAEREAEQKASRERLAAAVENLADMSLAMRLIIQNEAEAYFDEIMEYLGIEVPEEEPEDFDADRLIDEKLEAMDLAQLIKLLLTIKLVRLYSDDREKFIARLEAASRKSHWPEPEAIEAGVADLNQSPPEITVASDANIPEAPNPEAVVKIIALSCIDCGHSDECDGSPLYKNDGDAEYRCDKRMTVAHWPDKEAIKAGAKAEAAETWKQKSAEAIFHKSVRCSGCGEKHQIEFKLDAEDTTTHHWKGDCPKCGVKNAVKNARWDGMYGLGNSKTDDELEDLPDNLTYESTGIEKP